MAIPWQFRRVLCQAVSPATLLLAAEAWAAPPALAASEVLPAGIVAVEPWAATAGDRQGLGFLVFDQISQLSSRPIKATALPLPRLLNELKGGSVALAVLAATDDRDVFAERVCELGKFTFGLAIPKSSKGPRTLPELSGKTYAMIRGVHNHVLPQLTSMKPYPVTNMTQGFSMLSMSRVDAAICVRPGCASAMRNTRVSADDMDYLPLLSLPIVIYATKASRGWPDFEALKAGLKERCAGKEAQTAFAALLAQFD
ncbi:polar amino acid transport system substrate-binding protein [Roseateles sp. YR242]|uniref:hypothetical protein n=1 Tax=Roseateles sp. YR242 TaxID=1855305 RepID=UPI0008C8768B|nr:hypothetical protein [Roseateles sp. YR242]SEK40870.1 polar amino acid transport system substrate-binding protein [Roseateles sp. YR242]